jgi:hypothetical protein
MNRRAFLVEPDALHLDHCFNLCALACNALDGPQDEPGGQSAGLGFARGDRRAPSTVAVGDERPMNPPKMAQSM